MEALKQGMICRFRSGDKGVLVKFGDNWKIRHITIGGQVVGNMIFTEEELQDHIVKIYKKRDNRKSLNALQRWRTSPKAKAKRKKKETNDE